MHGRGYVNNGDKIAAKFIVEEFKKIGLESKTKNFVQPFTTSVNSFPGKMSVTINDKLLSPGKDYQIEPGSPSVSGTFETVNCNEEDFLYPSRLKNIVSQLSDKFIVIHPCYKELTKDEKKTIQEYKSFFIYSDKNTALGTLILSKEKLTWGASTEVLQKPTFTLKIDSVSKDITSLKLDIENKFIKKHKTQNIIGFIKGATVPDSTIVLTAHYDHLGRMGKDTYYPGANDNASGIAMLLNMAKYYKDNPPKYSVLFIAFAGEEIGLVGSTYYVENPVMPLKKIKFLINFDISGTGDEGIQVVNGNIFKTQFDRLQKLNSETGLLTQVKVRGESCNSDHCMFFEKGVPCFFIYTLGGIKAYHDIYDKSETLPFTDFEDYFKLMIRFIDHF